MKEEWKKLSEYPLHEISNFGQVRSLDRIKFDTKSGNPYIWKGKLLVQKISTDGYMRVGLSYETILSRSVHRLVAEAFIDNPDKKRTVNHIDGNKTNNRVENLEWCTHLENVHHAMRIGLKKQARGVQFVNRTKLDEAQVRTIKSLKNSHLTQKEIASYFRVDRITINDIYNGRTWRHV